MHPHQQLASDWADWADTCASRRALQPVEQPMTEFTLTITGPNGVLSSDRIDVATGRILPPEPARLADVLPLFSSAPRA